MHFGRFEVTDVKRLKVLGRGDARRVVIGAMLAVRSEE